MTRLLPPAFIALVFLLSACEKEERKVPLKAPPIGSTIVEWFDYYRDEPTAAAHSLTVTTVLQFKAEDVRPHLPYLLSCLKDEDVELRVMVVGVLRKLGPAIHEAGPALENCLDDRDARVRVFAANALLFMDQGEPKAVSVLFDEVANTNSRYRKTAVEILRDQVVLSATSFPELEARMESSDPVVRSLALITLVRTGAKTFRAARPAIEKRLKDSKKTIRSIAKQAIDVLDKNP